MQAQGVYLGHPWRCCWGDISGRIQVVVDGGLLEDILEAAEGLDGGFAHVGEHSIV
jgi:hypothetical protein